MEGRSSTDRLAHRLTKVLREFYEEETGYEPFFDEYPKVTKTVGHEQFAISLRLSNPGGLGIAISGSVTNAS